MSLNPYTVLELPSTATAAEIKAAYKRLAFQFHPDRNQGSSYHTLRFQQIAEAYDILSDPDKRARFDRRFGTAAAQQASASQPRHRDPAYRPRQGPGPYGNSFTGDPFRAGQARSGPAPGNTFTGKGGRRYSYPSPHQIFIAITLLACFAMGSLWFGSVMDRKAAKQQLEQGNLLGALEFDSTYGEAWFELGRRQAERGMNEAALRNMDRGMRLADYVHADWYWARGRLAEQVGDAPLAIANYHSLLHWPRPDSVSAGMRDSLRIRLATLMLYTEHRNDSAFSLLTGLSENAAQAPSAQFLRGLSALRTGRYTESITSLQAAADALYYPGEAYYYLGFAFQATADSAKACTAWDIALTSGCGARADSVLRRYCTFGTHTSATEPLILYVKP